VTKQYSDAECLSALRSARQQLGESPTRREYEELDLKPSAKVIENRFGSWTDAKLEAGLRLTRIGRPAQPVRESYFESIDSVAKAYWLGFLFGDGHVAERNEETGKLALRLSLAKKDSDHLKRFKRTIRSESALIEDQKTLGINVGNQQFVEHLTDKGLTPTKGHDGVLPNLSSWSLRRAFVRGLADADGYYGPNKWTIADATPHRLENLQRWVPVETEVVNENYDEKSWSSLRVSRGHRLVALYGWLFPRRSQTEPAMPRKKETAIETLRESI
jgi:hypothetical protein